MPTTFNFNGNGPFTTFTIAAGSTPPQTGTISPSSNAVNFTFSVSAQATGGTGAATIEAAHTSNVLLARGIEATGASLTYSAAFTLQIDAPTTGASYLFSNPVVNASLLVFLSFGGPVSITFLDTAGATVAGGGPISGAGTFSALGEIEKIRFTASMSPAGAERFELSIDQIVADLSCFTAGTHIATPDGPQAVETLVPGDRVMTADGRETAVRWLGEQRVDTRLTHPAKVNPICIAAGALADGVPSRDLWLSADHAVCIDGLLINAGALVNSTTIYQVAQMPLNGFTYYHVETDAHELLLAENTPAESFIDYAGRDGFINGEEHPGTASIPEMGLHRISSARLVPDALRSRLHARAGHQRAA
ncbi:MAG: Hint domain-containing protein [Rhodobacter sp.]|nr:Hint domain-containing protein [Rhodobacter sp.]